MMRLTTALLLLGFIARQVNAADPTCIRGVKSEDKSTCCPDKCKKCGGDGCQQRAGGYNNCCGTGVRDLNRSCKKKEAPCTLGSGGKKATEKPTKKPSKKPSKGGGGGGGGGAKDDVDPYCVYGIMAQSGKLKGKVCCLRGCAQCGGSDCKSDRYGEKNCCPSTIYKAEQSCDKHSAPCVINTHRPVVNDPKAVKRKTVVGVLPGPAMSLEKREKKYKVNFESELLYQRVQDMSWWSVQDVLNSGKKVDLVIEFIDSYPNLGDIGKGKYDKYLKDFGKDAAADGRQINVRPMHEFNADWYPWGALRLGNTKEEFKVAFVHVVTVLRSTGANFKYQMSYAMKNSGNDPTPLREFYVGKQYVDQICVSAYNLCGTKYPDMRSLATIFGSFYYQVTSFAPGTKLCMAEMGTTSYCGGKPQWIKDAWKSLAYQFTEVININWFLENKVALLGVDWDLNNEADVAAWVQGLKDFKKVTNPDRRLEIAPPIAAPDAGQQHQETSDDKDAHGA